jgi:hypothetical protein
MPTALFTVKATIAPEREKAFNEWYNHEHIPDVLKFKGVVHMKWLRQEYDKHFGGVSERQRASYVQVWP